MYTMMKTMMVTNIPGFLNSKKGIGPLLTFSNAVVCTGFLFPRSLPLNETPKSSSRVDPPPPHKWLMSLQDIKMPTLQREHILSQNI